jgi:lysophospholipase L1-like esterase
MNGAPRSASRSRDVARLLTWLGWGLIGLAAACNPWTVELVLRTRPLPAESSYETHRTQIEFLAAGSALVVAGLLAARNARIATHLERRWVTRLVLACLSFVLPLFVLERTLSPLIRHLTTIFERDPELGWKHKPGVRDYYCKVPVRINSHGLRGGEIEYEKPAGVRRVLFLGDSVVFGLHIADEASTLPAQVQSDLAAATSSPVECINSGVAGYATWQEHAYLVREGYRYDPDLVVLCFVLNDVTDRVRRTRFSGRGVADQMVEALPDSMFAFIDNSSIVLVARTLQARLAYGADVREGAKHSELLGVYHLIYQPDLDEVQSVWKATLHEIDDIVGWCRARKLPLVIVSFPYSIQLADPSLDAPQWILRRFAERRGIEFVDAQPILVREMRERHVTDDAMLFDALHPTPLANEIVARELSRRIVEGGLLLHGTERSARPRGLDATEPTTTDK